MEKDHDIVLQGPIFPGTIETAKSYADLPFVNRIILSCWESDNPGQPHERISVIKNPLIPNCGIGNRNCQVVTSKAGLSCVSSAYSIKMRSDQCISKDSMLMMREFFEKFKASPVRFHDGSGPLGRVHVIGMYRRFPFHPQDHVFWGYSEDVRKVFDIPLSDAGSVRADYTKELRTNMYIGMYYYARFDQTIRSFIGDPKTYLVDGAPKYEEAMAVYNRYRDDVLKVFPRIDMWWEKYKIAYPYDWGIPYTEYWHDEPWR